MAQAIRLPVRGAVTSYVKGGEELVTDAIAVSCS